MKVLVADKFPESGLARLAELGCEVTFEPDAKEEALVGLIRESNPEILVVRSTKVTAPMLEVGCLTLVVRAGAGYNTIDVAKASACGVYVANCPGKNSIAVAELAFGLILSLDRRIPDNVIQLREGQWNKKAFAKAAGLYGRTLGLIGLGSIGTEMVSRARAFGLNVVAWSRSLTDAKAAELGIERKATVEQVAAAADVVSVHLALNDETRGMMGATFFDAMRPGAFFVNTSRAEIVDEAALRRAISDKGVRAGLDVFAGEPAVAAGEIDDELARDASVYGTHHIGASTEQAQASIADETCRIVEIYKLSGHVPNVVNLARRSPARFLLVVRHRDRVGVLAHVLSCLKEAGVNVQEMENVIFDGAEAAIARIRLDNSVGQAVLDTMSSGSEDVLETKLLPLEG